MSRMIHKINIRLRAWLLILMIMLTSACSSGAAPSTTPAPTTVPTALPTAIPTPAPTPTEAKQVIDLKPCVLAGNIKANCGTYTVFEDREAQSGRKIDLRIAVVPASSGEVSRAPEPMVYLAGGPGGSAIESFLGIGPAFRALNQRHDWLLVDQRGTGGSNRLVYPPLPPTVYTATTQAEAESILRPWMEEGLKTLDGDPRFYTTRLAVDDIDEVAQALGYRQVNLYGGSYGATTVQYYLRQHPDHVRTAIMDGGTMVDIPIFELIAANGQRALDLVFSRCENDPACSAQWPNARAEMQTVFERLGKEPVTVPDVQDLVTRQPMVLSQAMFAEAVRTKLLNAAGATTLPRLIHHAYEGDYSSLAATYRGSQAQIADGGRLVMSWAIRCSEQWAELSPDDTATAGTGTYFADLQVQMAQQTEVACQIVPKGPVPEEDGERVRSDVPVLILNGDTDPQDPPESVADAERELPNSLRVTVPGQGHGVIQTGCLYQVARDFVDSGTVEDLDVSCVENMPIPPFDLSD